MTIATADERGTATVTTQRHGVRIDADRLSRRVRVSRREEVTLLDAVSFTIPAGELVAIVGRAALERRRC
jgi:ABC-type multidrug transport system fused ATPase/permease subunit